MADLLKRSDDDRAWRFRFTVKESADGTPWIAAEPSGKLLPAIPGELGFELKAGTSYEEAKSVCRLSQHTHRGGHTHHDPTPSGFKL